MEKPVQTNSVVVKLVLHQKYRTIKIGITNLDNQFLILFFSQNCRFYWVIHDLFTSIHINQTPLSENITGQLIWREYFYTMSVDNPQYGQVANNPICLDVGWREVRGSEESERWRKGQTGYPFIDAAMRQLRQVRN